MHSNRLLLLPSFIYALSIAACSDLQRSNPYDSHSAKVDATNGAAEATLSLRLPLAKALAIVVYRVEAILEGPCMPPIIKELTLLPLGPATGTIGALQPGTGFSLTLRGYDIEDELLFEGHQENISIVDGDTTLVEIDLVLLRAIPDLGGDETTGDGTTGDGTG
jgi:hypothetical protein